MRELPVLWLASGRHLLRHPAQLALALVGLALGVGTLVAVDIATRSAGRAFERSLGAVNGPATQQIEGGPRGIDENLYVQLRRGALAGIAAAPVVQGYASTGARALQLLGIEPIASAALDPHGALQATGAAGAGPGGTLASLGRFMTVPGAVLLSERTAHELGVQRGGHLHLQIAGREQDAVLIDTLTAAGTDTLVVTDIAQAQEWLGLEGRLSRIDLRLPDGAAGSGLLALLKAGLPPAVHVVDTRARARATLDMTGAFTTNLTAMSLLALLVSTLLIYGAMSFAVLQRRRSLSILRALGASRGEVLALILVETVVLGLTGAAVGVLLGSLIGSGLVRLVARTINDLYYVVAVSDTHLPAGALWRAALAGCGTALAGGLAPALEVIARPPQMGLRRSVLEAGARRLAARLLPVSAALGAGAGLALLLPGRGLLAGFTALFLLLASVAAATPAVLRALARAAADRLARGSPILRLGLGGVAGSLSRTGVAVAALGIALAAMIGVSIMVESFRESLRDWLGNTLSADVYVSAPGPSVTAAERRIDPGLIARIGQLPGVRAVGRSRRVQVESARGPVALDAVWPAGEGRARQVLTGEHDWQRALERGAVLVSEPLAGRLQLTVGASLPLQTGAGLQAFTIASIYREYGNDRGTVTVGGATYVRYWDDPSVTGLALYLRPGVTPDAVVAAVQRLAPAATPLLVRSNASIRELSMQIFERTFVITRVLYWLAAGVAALGLVSALLAWELERAHALAVLRAIGLTPRGAAFLIESQTAFMGFAAFVAAVPAGLLTALVLTEVINRRAFGWQIDLHLRAAQFGNALILALAAALAAGAWPAWRAARALVAGDLREE